MERRALKQITSTGSAMNIELGFVPNWVHTQNITQWEQATQNVELYWNSKMADGSYYGYKTQAATTDGGKFVADTSNGFTPYDTEVFAARQMIITGASKGSTCRITIGAGHGLTVANNGDTIVFNLIGLGSMAELNGVRATMTYYDATNFDIDVDSTNFTAWSSTYNYGIAMNMTTQYDNTGYKGITLGSIPAAGANDVIILDARWYDSFEAV